MSNKPTIFDGEVRLWPEGDKMSVSLSGSHLRKGVRVSTKLSGAAGIELMHQITMVRIESIIEHLRERTGISTEVKNVGKDRSLTFSWPRGSLRLRFGDWLHFHPEGVQPDTEQSHHLAAAVMQISQALDWEIGPVPDSVLAILVYLLHSHPEKLRLDADRALLIYRTEGGDEVPMAVVGYTDAKGASRVGFALGYAPGEVVHFLAEQVRHLNIKGAPIVHAQRRIKSEPGHRRGVLASPSSPIRFPGGVVVDRLSDGIVVHTAEHSIKLAHDESGTVPERGQMVSALLLDDPTDPFPADDKQIELAQVALLIADANVHLIATQPSGRDEQAQVLKNVSVTDADKAMAVLRAAGLLTD